MQQPNNFGFIKKGYRTYREDRGYVTREVLHLNDNVPD